MEDGKRPGEEGDREMGALRRAGRGLCRENKQWFGDWGLGTEKGELLMGDIVGMGAEPTYQPFALSGLGGWPTSTQATGATSMY